MCKYLIIGGSSGIGKALTKLLSDQGNTVFATYNKSKIRSVNAKVIYNQLDVLQTDLDFSFLPDQIDGVVYCPGTINLLPFHRINSKEFLEDYKLQVVGAVKVLQHVLPKLKKSDSASVVFFSTVAAQHGFNFHSQVGASKGAIEGLTKSLAAEWAPKIRVNAVAPSITNTPLAAKFLNSEEKLKANIDRHPLKKIGEPEDIANMVSFLLSKQAAWVTGQIITLDGGISSVKL